MATACLILPISAGETHSTRSGSAQHESSLTEAQELLRKGDESYTAGHYADAAEAYAGAREMIPDGGSTAELHAAATERYAQASVEQAREMARKGDIAGAKAVVDKVLSSSVAPGNAGARAYRDQLDDPIRTNQALTKEHVANVDSVRRLLYTAQGAYDLGDYDKAITNYESVLRIDPANTAARRGMEQVAKAKSDYAKSAQDHTRAEMLAQVDSQWELQVPEPEFDVPTGGGGPLGSLDETVSIKNKLDRIIIPKLMLDQATLAEALDFLRIRAAESDTTELDPAHKGVNFAVNLGDANSPDAARLRNFKFDLKLTKVPLSQVLKYITEITQTSYRTDDFSVIISPHGSSSPDLVTRIYRVPPDFISSLGASAASTTTSDPFTEGSASGGAVLARRLGAQEALAQQGVTFGEGASATYLPANSTLRVVNTEANQEYIAQIVAAAAQTEPIMVSVTVTMIKTEQTNLTELGFDWLLSDFDIYKSGLHGSGGTVGNGSPLDDVAPPLTPPSNPVTSGNRSGDMAISRNGIDDLIRNQGGSQADARAPGVFGLHGEIDDATVNMLMRGLNQKKGVDLMAKPAVTTRSGQSSSISIVREFIYPTEYEPPELPNSTGGTVDEFGIQTGSAGITPVTPATPTAFDKRDVGITMEVLPVVDAGKRTVNVTLNPTFSDFDGFVNYGSPINSTINTLLGSETMELTKNAILMPVFSTNRVNTSVDVADGATVVIGGLKQETVQNVQDKTPVLSSIPFAGRFFASDAKQTITTAVLFLVKVEVVDPTGRRYADR